MPVTYHPNLSLLAAMLSGRQVQLSRSYRRAATKLLKTALDHGVTAMLDIRVREGTVRGLIEEDRKGLRKVAFAQGAYDLILNAATRRALDLLAAENIPALLLKGTPVAYLYYEDTYLRRRCDTDIFIRSTDREQAAEVLAANGYGISGLHQRSLSSKQFVATQATRQGFVVSLDIHWRLSNRVLFNDILRFEECWETRQPLPVLGGNAYTLSAAHLLLHACIHRIAHGRNTQRNRLLWLYDIHLITGRLSTEDFGRFKQLAMEKQVGALCRDAFVMCQYYFRTRYPEHYLSALARNQRLEPTADLLQASKPRWVLADLLVLKTLRQKLAFAGELLFPPHLAEEKRLLPRIKSWTTHLLSRVG